MSALLLDPTVDGILAGAGTPPAADERRALGELGALVAAAAHRRPEIPIVLAGGMAAQIATFGDLEARPGGVLVAPSAHAGPEGSGLHELLIELALPDGDSRRALGAAAATLADVLDRRVDVVEIGFRWRDQGRRLAGRLVRRTGARPRRSSRPRAWRRPIPTTRRSTGSPAGRPGSRDRHRLRDRMRELRIAPWADATGEGVGLAPGRRPRRAELPGSLDAGLGRPARRPTSSSRPAASGRSTAGPAVALALVDVLRRAGAAQFALDHARLLAPLGAIPDAGERRTMLADLADDLLAPLGHRRDAGGLRPGRSAGDAPAPRLDRRDGAGAPIRAGSSSSTCRRAPTAVAEFRFRDTVRLGGRGRHFAIDVTGGLGGLLVDLRDVPLRLPDRADLRRELLESLAGGRR